MLSVRYLFLCVTALLSGIYMACGCPELIPMALLLSLCFLLLVACFFTKHARLPFCMVLFFILGAFHMQHAADLSHRPLQPYLDEYITVTADCVKRPEAKAEGGTVVTARLRSICFLEEPAVSLDETVRLFLPAKEAVPGFGESFTAICRFSEPAESLNQNGFNYNVYLRSQGIFYTGTVEAHTLQITGSFKLSPRQHLYALQQRSAQTMATRAPRKEASILQAIALGETSYMPEVLEEALQICGLSHVTAVSGMHVSTLIAAVYALLAALHRNRYRYSWLVAAFIVFFMLFTGMSPSVVRASVMSLLVLGSYMLYRSNDPLTSLAFAAALLVAVNPYAAFDMGFVLSFTSTLGIVLFASPMHIAVMSLLKAVRQKRVSSETDEPPEQVHYGWQQTHLTAFVSVTTVTISAQLFTLPVASWLFGYTSCWSLLTNLLVAPLSAVILVGGFLLGLCNLLLPFLATPLAGFCYPFVRLFLLIVEGFGGLRQGLATVAAFSPFSLYVYIVFLYGLFYALKQNYRRMCAAFCSALLLIVAAASPIWPDRDMARVTFVNVGQGDCTLLQLPNHITVLVDGGGVSEAKQSDFDVGGRVVMPYLRKAGVKRIDYMIASHPHSDHMGGLESLLDLIPVGQLFVPIGFENDIAGRLFLNKAQRRSIPVQRLRRDMTVEFSSDCFLHALLPDDSWLDFTADANDLSLVLRFVFGRSQFLLMGDLGAEGERYLTEQLPQIRGYSTVLKVGHHGSESSTTDAFLAWGAPRYAVISCGENSFGHPADEVLGRLSEHGVKTYRTDMHKDVTFILGKKGIHAIKTGDSRYDEG